MFHGIYTKISITSFMFNKYVHLMWISSCRDCAECKAFNSGPMIDNCTVSCSHVVITFEEDSASGRKETKDWCSEKDITFAVTHTDEAGRIHILVKKREGDNEKCILKNIILKAWDQNNTYSNWQWQRNRVTFCSNCPNTVQQAVAKIYANHKSQFVLSLHAGQLVSEMGGTIKV